MNPQNRAPKKKAKAKQRDTQPEKPRTAIAVGTPQPLKTMRKDPRNARRMTEEALQGLGVSLAEFDDLSGIVLNDAAWTNGGLLVCGHQRLTALQEAGVTEWRRIDATSGVVFHPVTGAEFRVRIVDWSKTKHRLAQIVANNPLIQGTYTDTLVSQLEELEGEANFAELMLQQLADQVAEELDGGGGGAGDPEPGEDDVPEPPAEPITKPGDLWILGDHRLLCGDSTKEEDVARLMDGERAGLMNTDPPYGIAYTTDDRPNPKQVASPLVANDDLTDEKLQEFLERAFRAATAHALKEDAAWYLWHAHLTQGYFAAAAAAAAKVVLHRQIIWVKPVLVFGRGQYHWKHEPCFMGWVEGNQPPDYGLGNGERTQTTVWEVAHVTREEREEFNHATPKPVGLFVIPIVKHLKPGEICYEPFSGSGPQFIAAERCRTRCFGIELEPKFCDVIVARWEKFTGRKAVRAPRK